MISLDEARHALHQAIIASQRVKEALVPTESKNHFWQLRKARKALRSYCVFARRFQDFNEQARRQAMWELRAAEHSQSNFSFHASDQEATALKQLVRILRKQCSQQRRRRRNSTRYDRQKPRTSFMTDFQQHRAPMRFAS